MEDKQARKVRLYLYFIVRRNELLKRNLLGNETDDFALEMLDFVWDEFSDTEHEAVNSFLNKHSVQSRGGSSGKMIYLLLLHRRAKS